MVTIKEVAALAGVSFKTVSRVVNNDPTVTVEYREKVLKAIQESGYRPNRAASLTRRQKSNIIALIADELLTVPYTFDIIRGAQDMAWEHSKELLIFNVNDHKRSLDMAVENIFEHRVEGVIYSAMYHQQVVLPDELLKVPTVLANCFPLEPVFACVVPDEVQAAQTITEELLKAGYKRIAFLNLNENIVAARGRKQGVISAFKKNNQPMENLYIESVIHNTPEGEKSISREAAARIIDQFKPDAILCGQDPMAVEVYFVVHAKGLEVGKDIGIASFDDWDVIPTLLQPALSTMALPHYEMGRWAMQYLLDQRSDLTHQALPFVLSRRESF